MYSCGRAKAGQPASTYIQQLPVDTGCRLEDLPGAIDDRDGGGGRLLGRSLQDLFNIAGSILV